MRSLVVLGSAREILDRLKPSAFEAKVALWLKGGLPGQSMSDGRGGGQGLPMSDKVDKALRRARKRHHGLARLVLVSLQEMERIEKSVLLVHAPVPDEPIVFCETPGCSTVLDPGFTKGHCSTHRAKRYQDQRQNAVREPSP